MERREARGAACGSALVRDPGYGVLITTDRARACSHQSLVPSSLSGFHRECAGDRFLLIFGFILKARALLSSLR